MRPQRGGRRGSARSLGTPCGGARLDQKLNGHGGARRRKKRSRESAHRRAQADRGGGLDSCSAEGFTVSRRRHDGARGWRRCAGARRTASTIDTRRSIVPATDLWYGSSPEKADPGGAGMALAEGGADLGSGEVDILGKRPGGGVQTDGGGPGLGFRPGDDEVIRSGRAVSRFHAPMHGRATVEDVCPRERNQSSERGSAERSRRRRAGMELEVVVGRKWSMSVERREETGAGRGEEARRELHRGGVTPVATPGRGHVRRREVRSWPRRTKQARWRHWWWCRR
ncbi:formin-like protein 1 [Iris pallida]|uniref:Formin-like protein 1 n=1 Tax=Iris pallida TaxID=29817 RepID=A0AAX6DGP0_IRIPA|nr:formin-like protein 1 [Iris pallida]